MTTSQENNSLNTDDRLKGIAYQFLKLYERWAEDRQVFNKNMAAFEEMLKIFINQIKEFEKLESRANNQILISAEKAAKHVCAEIGTMVGNSITREVDSSTIELKKSVNEAISLLKNYQAEGKSGLFWGISAIIASSILTSLFLVWLLIPAPKLPLTDDQLNTYYNGHFFGEFWPKLSKKEQKQLTDLANQSAVSRTAATTDTTNSENATDNSSQ